MYVENHPSYLEAIIQWKVSGCRLAQEYGFQPSLHELAHSLLTDGLILIIIIIFNYEFYWYYANNLERAKIH